MIINGGRSFAFHPVAEMAEGTHYQIKVITNVTDLAGNSLAIETFYSSGYTTTLSPYDYSSWDIDVWER